MAGVGVDNFKGLGAGGYIALGLLLLTFFISLPVSLSAIERTAKLTAAGRFAVVIAIALAGLGLYLAARSWMHAGNLTPTRMILAAGILLFLCAVVLASRPIARVSRNYLPQIKDYFYGSHPRCLVWIGTLLAWAGLMLIAQTPTRLWGLWGLQVVLVAGAAALIPRTFKLHGARGWAFVALFLALVAGQNVLAKVQTIQKRGAFGREPDDIQAARSVARLSKRAGITSPRIGYHIGCMEFEFAYNQIDAAYKVGSQFDAFLWYELHVRNADLSRTGFSDNDDFRILQTALPESIDLQRCLYFPFSDSSSYELVENVGVYQIWARPEIAAVVRNQQPRP